MLLYSPSLFPASNAVLLATFVALTASVVTGFEGFVWLPPLTLLALGVVVLHPSRQRLWSYAVMQELKHLDWRRTPEWERDESTAETQDSLLLLAARAVLHACRWCASLCRWCASCFKRVRAARHRPATQLQASTASSSQTASQRPFTSSASIRPIMGSQMSLGESLVELEVGGCLPFLFQGALH